MSNENKIRILYVQPGKYPEERLVANELRPLQRLVGGDIQAVYPWSKDKVALIYLDERVTNEEKRANAAAMRRAFDAWLEEISTTVDPAALTEVPDRCEGRFDTLAEAIAHIDHILRFPDLLLI